MPGWREVAAAAVLLAVGTTGAAAAAGQPRHETLFRWADPRIDESSGLVDLGDYVATVNDSGDGPVVYVVDARTGETVGVTTYSSGEVADVESLAPGRDGSVWAADIGDNRRSRDQVTIYRLPDPGPGDRVLDAPRYDLVYPDGPRDAETVLVHPRTGRVYVVSKSVFGGNVYAAPRTLRGDRVNRLRKVAWLGGLFTDGSFLPDGRHLLLRGYGGATVYTFPGFATVGSVDLPEQEQGEAVAVGADGRILVSSEGVSSPVLEIVLPARLLRALAPPEPSPSRGTGTPTPHADTHAGPTTAPDVDNGVDWQLPVGLSLVAAAVLLLLYRLVRS